MDYDQLEGLAFLLYVISVGVGVVLGAGLAVAAVDGIAGGIVYGTSDINENSKVVEHNIQEGSGFASFDTKAYGVAKKGDVYYAQITGEAVVVEGAEPVFASLTYEIDKELYSTIKSTYDVKYTLEADHSVVDVYNNPTTLLFTTYAARKDDILEQLTKVTQQKIVEKRIFTNSQEIANAAVAGMGSETQIKALGNVKYDEGQGIAWFNLDVARKVDNAIVMKRLVVTVPLSNEIIEDPTKAYTFYAQNPDKCTIDEIENGKTVLCQATSKDGDKVYTVVDDELVL